MFIGKTFSRRVRSTHLLSKYYGENSHWNNGCLIGRIFEDEAKEVYCTIDGQTIAMPSDCFGVIALCIKDFYKNNSHIICLENLWNYMNEEGEMGVFFPVDLGDNSIYFLYCQFARKYLAENGTLVAYSKLLNCYPVLLATIEQEVISALGKPSSVPKSIMTGTVEIIDRVLQRGNFPSIQLIHSLANMKYENQNNEGVICFTNGEGETKLRFHKPQPLVYEEIRALRKYFQMTGENLNLIAEHYHPTWASFSIDPAVNVWMIQGIGECKDTMGKLYFSSGKKWKFIWDKEEIGYDGAHFFARKHFAREQELLKDLKYLCTEEEVKKFTGIVERLMNQKHGTMLVISSIARDEASRLGELRRAMEVEDYDLYNLTDQEMLMVSSIDGCILSDTHGNCTALGAILDGEANIATDIGRGARYNSALTYIKKMKNEHSKAAAIVISEDGSVDIILTETIREKKSYSDEMRYIEDMAYYDIQDARFEQRFIYLEEDDDDDE